MRLQYFDSAKSWNEAIPIGNGRLGAMIYGGPYISEFKLNEDTLWSGMPNDIIIPPIDELQLPMSFIKDGAYKYEGADSRIGSVYRRNIQKIRNAILEKNYSEANKIGEEFLQGGFSQSYMTFGSLLLKFIDLKDKKISNYKRELDIENSLYKDYFQYNDDQYIKKEVFASYVDNCIVINVECSEKLDIQINFEGKLIQSTLFNNNENHFCAYGKMPSFETPYRPNEAIRFEENKGIGFIGGISFLKNNAKNIYGNYSEIKLNNCSNFILVLDIISGFKRFNENPQSNSLSLYGPLYEKLKKLSKLSYQELKDNHIKDYRNLYSKLYIDISDNEDDGDTFSDQDIDNFQYSLSPKFISFMYQYSRYLLISCSRKGTQPANLQGIWNDSIIAPWSSNYTININLPMNYWLTGVCNLDECIYPLFNMIKELSISGEIVASQFYGCRGWTCHHNSDIWRHALPTGNGPQHTLWCFGSAWLCLNLWSYYKYTEDEKFLINFMPILRGAVLFYIDYMVFENGHYNTIPSTSPENTFFDPKNKNRCSIAMNSAMDISLLKNLFNAYLKACHILNYSDEQLSNLVEDRLSKIAPIQINVEGGIAEWYNPELLSFEKEHRHISHLYDIYPGHYFLNDKKLKYAAINSLNERGDRGTGWSIVWKIAQRARLKDKDKINILLKNLIRKSNENIEAFNHIKDFEGIDFVNGAGIYTNFLLAHPPFQIDGSLGFAAVISECIVQSYNSNMIELLPSIPDNWKNGKIYGIKAEGNITINLEWKDGLLNKASLISKKDKEIKVKYKNKENKVFLKANVETNVIKLI